MNFSKAGKMLQQITEKGIEGNRISGRPLV